MRGILINSKYLKEYSPITFNCDTTEVKNYIAVATDVWVRPILGEMFTELLEDEIEKNNLSEANATLCVEALWPYLAFAVTYEALPFLWVDISNIGITLGKTETSESITLKDLSYVQQHLRTQVEVRKDQLIRWLNDHYEEYPLYIPICKDDTCGCACKTMPDGNLNSPNPIFPFYSTTKCIKPIR